jgi:hypothetical protein
MLPLDDRYASVLLAHGELSYFDLLQFILFYIFNYIAVLVV